MLLYQSCITKRKGDQTNSKQTTKPADFEAEITCIDSVDLDQRMIRKAEGAIRKRTSRLIIVVERCTNDHNYSAILRTAEALGVQNIWIISPQTINSTLEIENSQGTDESDIDNIGENATLKRSSGAVVRTATESEKKDRAMHHLYARKATEWLTVKDFEDTKTCLQNLREEGYQIWATDLGQEASCLTEDGIRQHLGGETYNGKLIPNKVAIVFGTEAVGCTTEMLNAADLRVYLPLRGFADSLNLSVATALVVHQLFVLDPTLEGAMSEEERKGLRQAWYAKLASQRLLSSADKKRRAKLTAYLERCEAIDKKINAGEFVFKEEREKWSKMDAKRKELNAIEDKLAADSKKAVKELVDNPPSPITDMRRADEHRICYVGKNTKKSSPWQDMPATRKIAVTKYATASFFRDRVGTEEEKKD
jgi:tRNA G18 (ribose-2'-O)-methylase SpoU